MPVPYMGMYGIPYVMARTENTGPSRLRFKDQVQPADGDPSDVAVALAVAAPTEVTGGCSSAVSRSHYCVSHSVPRDGGLSWQFNVTGLVAK